MLGHDAPGAAVLTRVGNRVEPHAQLAVQVLQVREAAREEEVGPHVAERPLDLALGLGAVGLAGPWLEAVVRAQTDQLGVVDDAGVVSRLAEYGRLHAVVQDLVRCAAEVLEGQHVAAQHRAQVLMQHVLAPEVAAVAEHHGEEPDAVLHAGLLGELDHEVCEVDLRLAARGGLEADLERRDHGRSDRAQEVVESSDAAGVAALAQLAQQPNAAEFGPGGHALAQVGLVGSEQRRPRRARRVRRHDQAARDHLANGLAVVAGAIGNGRHRQTLLMQFQNHHPSLQIDHPPSACRRSRTTMLGARRRAQPGLGPAALKDQTGEYSTGGIGECSSGGDKAGVETLLQATIEAARRAMVVGKTSVERVIVDSTVMPKAIAHPTDSRLLEKSRVHLVKLAAQHGLTTRQNYNRMAPRLAAQIGRHARAKQFKRMRGALRTLRTRVGRVRREVERQIDKIPAAAQAKARDLLQRTGRILGQRTQDKAKLYALHAPEVECISKGKARHKHALRVWCQGQHRNHARGGLGRWDAQHARQSVRRPHAGRDGRAGLCAHRLQTEDGDCR